MHHRKTSTILVTSKIPHLKTEVPKDYGTTNQVKSFWLYNVSVLLLQCIIVIILLPLWTLFPSLEVMRLSTWLAHLTRLPMLPKSASTFKDFNQPLSYTFKLKAFKLNKKRMYSCYSLTIVHCSDLCHICSLIIKMVNVILAWL